MPGYANILFSYSEINLLYTYALLSDAESNLAHISPVFCSVLGEPMSTEHIEEFGKLLICSYNPGIES